MHKLTLRQNATVSTSTDLHGTIQEQTYTFLMSSDAETARVSVYLDQDWPRVEAQYAELHLNDDCPFEMKINRVTPGSRTRKKIKLPGEMKSGEQLILEISRTTKRTAD